MNFQINEQAAAALSKRKKHNIYLLALSIAAVFTVIGVIIVLTRPGHAFSSLEKTLECQVEVHQHTADCYDAEGNLICGYADYVAHVHDPELCYDENGDLICQLPEIIPHEHDDSCYLERMVLICGCEEGQVVDSQGNPVFDGEGKPVFDIADVPDVESISVEGDLTEETVTEDAEAVDAEESAEADAEAVDAENADAEATDAEAAETEETEAVEAEGTEAANTENANTETVNKEENNNTESTDANVTAEENKEENTEEANTTETAESTEEAAPADTTETASEEEVITETVDLGQNAGLGEEEYSIHHHTAECYKIEKELICTIPTLHVHDSSCYDEEGNLICGQLQLTMHVHGEDCFRFEEKTVTQTVEVGDYIVTATYGASAKIPSKAEFRARIVEPESEEFIEAENALKEALGDENATYEVLFDVSFFFNGEEIEPEAPVEVTYKNVVDDFVSGDSYTFVHIHDDGEVDLQETIVNENAFNVTLDSFSLTGISQNSKKKVGIVENADALRVADEFKEYRTHSNNLGLANNFFAVAFGNYTSTSHVWGNICVNKALNIGQDFGTSDPFEASYIRTLPVIDNEHGMTNQPGSGNGPDKIIVFGAGTTVRHDSSEIYVDPIGKLDHPDIAYVEKNSETVFVDFGQMLSELVEEQEYLAGLPDSNASFSYTAIDQGKDPEDPNNKVRAAFSLGDNKDYAGVLNFTGAQFKRFVELGGNELRTTGFSDTKNNKGTLIINVNCENVDTININTEIWMYYANGNRHSKGHSNSSLDSYYDGKVLWNFYNSSNTHIIIRNGFVGTILAPFADVTIAENTTEGQIFANNIVINSEPHKIGFSGTDIPFSTDFTFGKAIVGVENGEVITRTPTGQEVFTFGLYELKNGKWESIKTVNNNKGKIDFGSQSYASNTPNGSVFWYKVKEIETENSSFIYDKKEFLVKVVIKNLTGRNPSADTTYYEITSDDDYSISGNNIDVALSKKIKKEDAAFNNTPNTTEVSVEKKWKDFLGEDLADKDIPEKITVYLFATTNNQVETDKLVLSDFTKGSTVGDVTCIDICDLHKKDSFKKTWKDLKILDDNNKPIYYFVTELKTTGFELTCSMNDWFKGGSGITQTLVNKEIPGTTFIEINKDFVAYGFGGGENNLLVLNSPFINVAPNPDAYVTFRLTRKPTVNGVVGEEEPYTDPVLVNGVEVTGGVFKVKAGTNNDWKAKVEQLPVASYENSTVTTYEYFVTETEEKSEEVKPYKFLDMKVSLAGEGKDAHKVFTVRNLLGNTEFEIDKTWLTYTGSIMTTLQDNPASDIKVPITIVQYNEDKTSFNDYGSYLLGAQSITDINGDSTQKAELIEDNASSTGKKLWAAKFTDLPAYYAEKQTDGKVILKKYTYSAAEGVISGYALITEPITHQG